MKHFRLSVVIIAGIVLECYFCSVKRVHHPAVMQVAPSNFTNAQVENQTPLDPQWEADYSRVKKMMATEIERNRDRDYDNKQNREALDRAIDELNTTSADNKPYFFGENHRVWGLIGCQYIIVNENYEWANRIYAGKTKGRLPLTAEMRSCIDHGDTR